MSRRAPSWHAAKSCVRLAGSAPLDRAILWRPAGIRKTLWSIRLNARIFFLLLVFLWPAAARADEAEALFQQALQAEQSLDFSAADAAYGRSLELRPSAPFAHRARIRLTDLRAHGEGGYAPLRRLEEVRRSQQKASDPAALTALFEDAQRFPPGRVKAEALLLIAEAFGRRLQLPAQAIPPASLLARDPSVDRPLRTQGLVVLVEAHLALGQQAQAAAVLAEFPGLAPALERRLKLERRRHQFTLAATGTLAAMALLLIASLVALRGRLGTVLRRLLVSPTSLATVALLVAGGASLTALYDESLSLRPFLLLGAGVLLVDRGTALAREALARSPRARAALATMAIASVLALAYLALLVSDPLYLESFGL